MLVYIDERMYLLSHSWDSNDAAVVCGQLGYQTEGAIGLKASFYGDGTGPIFLDEIDCSPEYDDVLAECFSGDIGSHDCDHQEDASVLCQGQLAWKHKLIMVSYHCCQHDLFCAF